MILLAKPKVQASDVEKTSDHFFVGIPLLRYRMTSSNTVSENFFPKYSQTIHHWKAYEKLNNIL